MWCMWVSSIGLKKRIATLCKFLVTRSKTDNYLSIYSSSVPSGPTLPPSDINVPTSAPTECKDDSSFTSSVNPNWTCTTFESLPNCDMLADLITPAQYEEILTSCPKACKTCGGDSNPSQPSGNGSPSAPSANQPSSGSSPSGTSAPSGSSPSGPSPSAPSGSSPSSPSGGSPTTDCQDNQNYAHPTQGWTCSTFENIPCSSVESFISYSEYIALFLSCPKACDVECGYIPLPPTRPPAMNTPTASPSASPTDCYDDSFYFHPRKPQWTCETFINLDCLMIRPFFTPIEFEEMLHHCPKACDVPCDYTPPPTENHTEEPTISPTSSPTHSPSLRPSTSFAPTDCYDDPNYVSPLNPNVGCQEIVSQNMNCMALRPLMTPTDFEDMFHHCPKACNVSCDYTPPPTSSPTGTPTASPSLKPSVSAAPTDCYDDPLYVFPLNENMGCTKLAEMDIDCMQLRPLCTPEGFLEMLRACPKACNVSCDYTPPPTVSPTATPSSSPSSKPSARPSSSPSSKPTSAPSIAPSVSHAPTDCWDDENYVSPIDPTWTCAFFEQFEDCMLVRPLCTPEAFEELLHKCPKACKVSCDYTPPPTESPTTHPSYSPSSAPSSKPSFIASSNPTMSAMPSVSPTSIPSVAPTNCPEVPDCQAHVCVDPNMINLALGGTASASSNTNRSNVNGPINGITDTSITPTGSTFESQDGDDQWWQVALPRAANISQIKIFACDGPECVDEGKKLNNIKVDIKLGNTIVSSHFFVYDYKPVMDIVLPFPIPGSSVRITKMQDDQVLSLSEVQVIGKMLNECSGTNC